MIFMNQNMATELGKRKLLSNKKKSDSIIKDIVENTILKNDCLLYDKDEKIQKSSISSLWIKENFFDFINYEATINEIRYGKSFFSNVNIFYLVDKLSYELETKFRRKLVLYLSLHDSDVDIRFHTLRTTENDWLDSNLDSYDNPIMCRK